MITEQKKKGMVHRGERSERGILEVTRKLNFTQGSKTLIHYSLENRKSRPKPRVADSELQVIYFL
jgi:hypothetical protein